MDSISSFPLLEGRDLVHFLYRGRADDMGIASDFIGERAAEPVHRVAGTDLFYYTAGLAPDARFNRFARTSRTACSTRSTRDDPIRQTWIDVVGGDARLGQSAAPPGPTRERPGTIGLGRLESRCGPGHSLSADITERVRE